VSAVIGYLDGGMETELIDGKRSSDGSDDERGLFG
jgi:hypothetical protein